MTDVINFNQYKSDMRLSSIGHPSTEEAIYNGVHEAVFFFKSKMDAQRLLAYARSIKSEKLQKHLLIVASSFGLLEVVEMLIDKGIDINSD